MKPYLLVYFLTLISFSMSHVYGKENVDLVENAKSEHFQVGQVWHYKTRKTETGSLLIIGKIDKNKNLGLIIHVKLVGLLIKNKSQKNGYSSFLGHIPIHEKALVASVTSMSNTKISLNRFAEGYKTWRTAFEKGRAGVFNIKVSEAVAAIEKAIN